MTRLADRIRQADDRISNIIDVEEWDVKIGIRSMTARQRAEMQQNWIDEGEQSATNLYSTVLLHCCFDPDTGEQVFSVDDLEWLLEEKSAQVVDSVAKECLKVSGLAGDSIDEAGKDFSDSEKETQS
jgi:hypothetical protein|tara:strand:+ start:432 stop:812 length:381 start_codon:yes stop_codon:yes gene_type:complete